MAKIVRKVQKIFGSTSGANQVAQFGSLANSTPNFTLDPTVIQALSQYLNGWFDAVIGGNSPAIEDMNALCYLFAYQLAYLMQEGVAEWDATTTYYVGSIVSDGNGYLFISTANTNLNQPLATSTNKWLPLGGLSQYAPTVQTTTIPTGSSLVNPRLSISSIGAYTVQTGASLYSIDSITIAPGGSLTIAPGGNVRVL